MAVGLHAEALDRLENCLPGAPEEGDPLVDLGLPRRVLQEKDVAERVPRPEDGRPVRAGGLGDLVAELVHLGDRLLQVALGEFVSRHTHGG